MTGPEHGGAAACLRIWAMIVKEIVQLRRDRVTLATMIAVPVFQLTLYGYAINTTPKHLPTAVLVQETSDVGRSILAALQNTEYFTVTHQVYDVEMLDRLLASGEVLFALEIPAGFERALRRGDYPALLAVSDGTDPVAIASAVAFCAVPSSHLPTTSTTSNFLPDFFRTS